MHKKYNETEGDVFVEYKKDYIKNIAHYLYESKFDFEFSQNEVAIVNNLIRNNDYSDDLQDLQNFLMKSNYCEKDIFLSILER